MKLLPERYGTNKNNLKTLFTIILKYVVKTVCVPLNNLNI